MHGFCVLIFTAFGHKDWSQHLVGYYAWCNSEFTLFLITGEEEGQANTCPAVSAEEVHGPASSKLTLYIFIYFLKHICYFPSQIVNEKKKSWKINLLLVKILLKSGRLVVRGGPKEFIISTQIKFQNYKISQLMRGTSPQTSFISLFIYHFSSMVCSL